MLLVGVRNKTYHCMKRKGGFHCRFTIRIKEGDISLDEKKDESPRKKQQVQFQQCSRVPAPAYFMVGINPAEPENPLFERSHEIGEHRFSLKDMTYVSSGGFGGKKNRDQNDNNCSNFHILYRPKTFQGLSVHKANKRRASKQRVKELTFYTSNSLLRNGISP